ncbi:hypothetical protein [Parasedimentitalea psychrophila]|uniref:Uncharacterized protein n=1 Tax=Parasedimentitalea psychrophila TaxID=2997337 RepID=A0A9Y2P6V4_9RHOB|nr:hypothetical protein [Parasedimentitalea psychrophila]WIY25110.1 hypothetical protein QPJ95_21905 [Parasedimentitalea psychrophila]
MANFKLIVKSDGTRTRVPFTAEEEATHIALIQAGIAAELPNKRAAASVTRMEFCIALAATDLLTHDEAIAAARGDWPAPMAEFLTFLDSTQSLDAQVEWASAATIHRMHPFVLSLGSWLVLTDTAVDALFGINT